MHIKPVLLILLLTPLIFLREFKLHIKVLMQFIVVTSKDNFKRKMLFDNFVSFLWLKYHIQLYNEEHTRPNY